MAPMPPAAPAPVTLVVGPEPLLARRAVATVLAGARAADPAVERRDVDLDADGGSAALREALSPTLFGDAAVVVLTGLESADDDDALGVLLDLLGSGSDGVCAVVVHPGGMKGKGSLDKLRKAGAAELAAEKVKGAKSLGQFVTHEMRSHRRRITTDAVAALRAAVGDDLETLAAACSQLAADVESDPVDADDVRRYHEGVVGVSGFAVSDAVWSADPVDVLVALRWVLEQDPGAAPLVVGSTANGLRSLMRLAGAPPGIGRTELQREVGAPSWKIDLLERQLQRWNRGVLARAAVTLAAADVAVKGGIEGEGLDPSQKRLVLERALLAIVRSRQAGRE
jgi:DNA polymerase-3 subunit delta